MSAAAAISVAGGPASRSPSESVGRLNGFTRDEILHYTSRPPLACSLLSRAAGRRTVSDQLRRSASSAAPALLASGSRLRGPPAGRRCAVASAPTSARQSGCCDEYRAADHDADAGLQRRAADRADAGRDLFQPLAARDREADHGEPFAPHEPSSSASATGRRSRRSNRRGGRTRPPSSGRTCAARRHRHEQRARPRPSTARRARGLTKRGPSSRITCCSRIRPTVTSVKSQTSSSTSHRVARGRGQQIEAERLRRAPCVRSAAT